MPSVTLAPVEPVAATTAMLTATGSDPDDAASTLKYAWTATGPKTVVFSPNGTTVSGSTTATFAAVGTYTMTVTVSDPAGLSAKATQTVVVRRVGSNPIASPASLVVRQAGETRTIAMSAVDQFGANYTPTITATQATGGTATAAGGTATFVSDGSYAATNISITVDTEPAQTVAIPVQQLSYPGLGTGLDAMYCDNIDFTGTSVSRTDPQVYFTWANGASPVSGIAPNTWSARWTGYIVAPVSGAITLATNSDDGIEVWVDRKPIIRNWTDHGPTRNTGTVAMTAGQKYEIIVNYYNKTSGGVAQLLWSYASQPEVSVPSSYLIAVKISGTELPIGNGTGFTVSYYNNDYFMGSVVGSASVGSIDYAWGTKPPVAGITGYRWSGIWRGTLEAPLTDTYTFMTSYTGSVLVYLDGKLVMNGAQRATNGMVSVAIPLVAGSRHSIEIRYANPDVSAGLSLLWSATGMLPTVVLGNRVYPSVSDNTPFTVAAFDDRINPVWIAGQASRSAANVDVKVDGVAASVVRGGSQWFIDAASASGLPPGLLMQAGQAREVSVSVEGKTETRNIVWKVIDIANAYGIDPMTIRRDDSLLLTHAGSGELLELDADYHETARILQDINTYTACANEGQSFTRPATCDVAYGANGKFVYRAAQTGTITFSNAQFPDPIVGVSKKGYFRIVTPVGFHVTHTGVAGQPIPVRFPQAGSFVVKARVGGVLANSLTVRAVGADLQGPTACEILYQRTKDVLVSHPELVSITADDEAALQCSGPIPIAGGIRLNLRPLSGAPMALQARLGADGPLIASQPIDAFMIETTAKRQTPIEVVYPDGSMLCSARLVLTPGVPNLEVRMNCFKAGVTFIRGGVNMVVNTSDFTAAQISTTRATWFSYEMFVGASVIGGVCHSFVVYQNNTQVSY